MKKIILISAAALSVSLVASMAMASLSSDIQSMGMCKAVGNAVSSGAPVSSIIAQSAAMKQADQKTLLTALYAAGVNDDAIRISAEKAKISDLVLIDAFNAHNKQGCIDEHSVAQNTAAQTAAPAVATAATTVAAPTVATTAASADPGQAAQKATPATDGKTASPASAAMPAAAPAVATAASQPIQKAAPASGKAASPASAASASWTVEAGQRPAMLGEYWDTFYKNYKTRGIDQAIILALTEGVQPAALLEGGLALEGLNPENLIKGMYCAGYRGNDIKKACDQLGISELVLVAGYKKSKAECTQDCRNPDDTQAYTPAEDEKADTQPYTPAAGPSMTGVPSSPGGGLSYPNTPGYASPSTF